MMLEDAGWEVIGAVACVTVAFVVCTVVAPEQENERSEHESNEPFCVIRTRGRETGDDVYRIGIV
jgi:ribonuclease PH